MRTCDIQNYAVQVKSQAPARVSARTCGIGWEALVLHHRDAAISLVVTRSLVLDYIAFQLFSFTLDAISGRPQRYTKFYSRSGPATPGKDPRLSQQIGLAG